MNELALFAGAGGGLLATRHLLGWRTVCYVENATYPVAVLKARIRDGLLDDAPIWDDARTFDGKPWRGCVDIITAGFPCQPFSGAGKRLGEADERNLWPDTARIIREVRPRYVFLENVPGLLSARGQDGRPYFGRILRDLAESGYDARWRVLSAAEMGAPHKRDRLWIVADADSAGLAQRKAKRFVPDVEPTQRPSWWETEPDVGRVVDGLAHRVDRLKSIGNGQVPLCTAVAFQLLAENYDSSI